MTNKEATKVLRTNLFCSCCDAENGKPYPECNDCKCSVKQALDKAIEALDEGSTGEWKAYNEKTEAYDISGIKTWGQKRECSNCGFLVTYIEDFGFYSYCPNCGAKMKGEEDG